jgi:hypothetical protein
LARAGAKKDKFDASTLIGKDLITKGLEMAIASGNWSLKNSR